MAAVRYFTAGLVHHSTGHYCEWQRQGPDQGSRQTSRASSTLALGEVCSGREAF